MCNDHRKRSYARSRPDQVTTGRGLGDRRAFRVWCQRRTSLLAKLERTLDPHGSTAS